MADDHAVERHFGLQLAATTFGGGAIKFGTDAYTPELPGIRVDAFSKRGKASAAQASDQGVGIRFGTEGADLYRKSAGERGADGLGALSHRIQAYHAGG